MNLRQECIELQRRGCRGILLTAEEFEEAEGWYRSEFAYSRADVPYLNIVDPVLGTTLVLYE